MPPPKVEDGNSQVFEIFHVSSRHSSTMLQRRRGDQAVRDGAALSVSVPHRSAISSVAGNMRQAIPAHEQVLACIRSGKWEEARVALHALVEVAVKHQQGLLTLP